MENRAKEKVAVREHPTELQAQIKAEILALAGQIPGGVSYIRLAQIPGFNGELNLAHHKFPFVMFWQGLSKEAADAIVELVEGQILSHQPTDELAYLAQGQTLDLPVFTSDHARRVSELCTPHWMPVVLAARAAPAKSRA